MKKGYLLPVFVFFCSTVFGQFKNDNLLYKTIFPQDLCKSLQQSKDFLLLDVRSNPEYADTSTSAMYNLGHLENSKNIDVSELGKKLSEIGSYKNKPIYVYCSHSQRSRRASKMLADSGFTNVINVNGGFTAIYQLPDKNCIYQSIVSKNGYKIMSVNGLCEKLSLKTDKLLILDVRTDSAYQRIDLNAKINSFGYFKNSVHIQLADLINHQSEIPADKEIVVVDLFGNDAAKAAKILYEHHYTNVSILLEGLDRLNQTDKKEKLCLSNFYTSVVQYDIMSAPDFRRFIESKTGYLLLDVRSPEEFTNRHKDYWKNIGHLDHAVNIPAKELNDKISSKETYRKLPVIVYAFSGSKEANEAAAVLVDKGFSDVHVLAGGLFTIRWTANNVSGNESLSKLVKDIPVENL